MSLIIKFFLMTFCGSYASFCLKKASESLEIKKLLINKFLYLGGMLYVFSALVNIHLLNQMDYSVVLPLTSITYIWTMVLSKVLIKEKITRKKVVGVISIFIGACFIAQS